MLHRSGEKSIYARDHFHHDIIRRTVWMYFLLNLNFRDTDELMAERGVDGRGTVLDVVVQRRRNTKAAMRLLRKTLKN